jgi:hypothetical protein
MPTSQVLDYIRNAVDGAWQQRVQWILAAGTTNFLATVRKAKAQTDPTATAGPGQIAPQPSPTPPRSIEPSATQPSFAPQPSPTPTPGEDSAEATETGAPEWPTPTPTQPVIVQPDAEDSEEQATFCPHPYRPFDWFCWPGSGGRWFPVIPPSDFAQLTGIGAYSVRGLYIDIANPSIWQMEAIAWDPNGSERARLHYHHEIEMDVHVGRVSVSEYNQAESLASIVIKKAESSDSEMTVEVGGRDVDLPLTGEPVDPSTQRDADEVYGLWGPLFAELAGLFGLTGPDDGELEGPGKCAVAGFLAGNACLASLSYTLFTGNFVCDDAFDLASSWCN